MDCQLHVMNEFVAALPCLTPTMIWFVPVVTQLTASLTTVKTHLEASDTKLSKDVAALSQQASQFNAKQREVLELSTQVREISSSLGASDAKLSTDLTALTVQATAFSEKQNEVLESYAQVRAISLPVP